jgi:hypothetical protein
MAKRLDTEQTCLNLFTSDLYPLGESLPTTKSLKTLMNLPKTTSMSGRTAPDTIMQTKAILFIIQPCVSL